MASRTSRAVLVLLLPALALAGCGGGSDKDAKELLKRAFAESINSANVTVDITANIRGVPQLSHPIRVTLGGPYQSNGRHKLPSLNWDLSVSGGGQTFSAGLISTGDDGFVNFQGTNYRLGAATMARLNQTLGQRSSGSGSFSKFGVDPLAWVKDAKIEGESDVAGVTTKHVSSSIDVGKLLTDLNKVVGRAGGAVGRVRPQQLPPNVIDQAKKVVHDPKFDVYVGKDDTKVRRVSLSLDFDVPAESRQSAGGLSGGNLSVSVELAAVGEPQKIITPASSKPISELAKQLGAARGLGGALGSGLGSGGGSSSGGSGGSSPTQQQYQRYAKCLNQADPSDIGAIQRCAKLLK